MSRDSRPPGFDMTYRPAETVRFGPSLRARLPAYLFAGVSACFALFVLYGHFAPRSSYAWHVVVGTPHPLPASTFAILALASGIAAILRSDLRGVLVLSDGIESREVLPLGVPRIRRLEWAMIDAFRFDLSTRLIGVDLWNGTREWLAEVGDRDALVRALVFIAEARAIPYTGGPEDGERPEIPYRMPSRS